MRWGWRRVGGRWVSCNLGLIEVSILTTHQVNRGQKDEQDQGRGEKVVFVGENSGPFVYTAIKIVYAVTRRALA